MDLVDIVESQAYDAWPAAEVERLGTWRLRFTSGVTRRGNSVWPGAHDDDTALAATALAERVDAVERWYAARRLAPAFQISPSAADADPHRALDAFLEERGYLVDAPVALMIGDAAAVARIPAAGVHVTVAASRTPEWFDVSARRGRFADTAEIYRGILDRIGGRARYAIAASDGRPFAVGLGVVGDGWMGVFSMLTVVEQRRRGGARAVLAALARAALDEGIQRLYLQVEQDNDAAIALYRSAFFNELHRYHYRVRASEG